MAEARPRGERGSVTPLIIGFAVVLLLTIAVVIDASAAFLHRQGLDTLADGAALSGADAGAAGVEVYTGGLGSQPLQLTRDRARAGVAAYLRDVGATRTYPGLSYDVSVRGDRVVVRLSAPVDLPLRFPGAPERPRVSSTGSAIVDPD